MNIINAEVIRNYDAIAIRTERIGDKRKENESRGRKEGWHDRG
jgi:hypothetical protein